MHRLKFAILMLVAFAALPLGLLMAQEVPPPASTEEAPPDVVVPAGTVPLPTPIGATAVPVSPIDPLALPILLNARTDIELLANQVMGADRPVGWSGSLDIYDTQLPLLIRLDLELLAGYVVAPDQRPPGWFGAVPSSAYAIARDIRHDVEVLADVVNQPNIRPPGWAGSDPLQRCDRAVQTLVNVLERGGVFSLNVDLNSPDFCHLAEVQASRFAEVNLLSNNGSGGQTAGAASVAVPGTVQIQSEFAVAFLTRFGSKRVGVIPLGELVTPIARSYTAFSKMMLVQGSGYIVFMDYRATTISDEQFAVLKDVDTVGAEPGCTAAWCQEPSG